MANISLRKWDYTPNTAENLIIETKITDLGSPNNKKSILGYFFSITQETDNTASTPAFYTLQFLYRQSVHDIYRQLGTISNIINGTQATKNNINKVVNFEVPIKNIMQVQLKIKSLLIQGDFSINDFGIMYREVRTTSVEKHDED